MVQHSPASTHPLPNAKRPVSHQGLRVLAGAGILAMFGVFGLQPVLGAADRIPISAPIASSTTIASTPTLALTPAAQKAINQAAALISVSNGSSHRTATGVILAGQNQILVAWSAIRPASPNADRNATIAAVQPEKMEALIQTASGAKSVPAKLVWFSPDDDLALLKCDGLSGLGVKLENPPAPGTSESLYAFHYPLTQSPAAFPEGKLQAGHLQATTPVEIKKVGLLATDFPENSGTNGNPIFNAQGQWLGFLISEHSRNDILPALSGGDTLRNLLFGVVRNIVVQADKFDPAVGGRVTVQADVQCAVGAPRSLNVHIPAPAGNSTPGLRPTPLRLNAKTGMYEATLTIPAAPGAIDLPVDESKLPEITKLNYKMDPDCMVAKRSNAKADSLYTTEFFNKFIEITTPAGRKKIYFSALVNAKFASDGSATVLTTDNRTLTGRLESKFTYQVGGASMKWTCGTEQITYIEIPGAKAAEKKTEITLQVTGTAADGSALTSRETLLK